MAIVSDLFFATSDVFMRKGKEDWHGANWEGARSFIDNVLEPAPKCCNSNFRVHTGNLKKPQWIHDNGGSIIPKHCCHRCLVTDGREHGPLCEKLPPSGAWRGTPEQKTACEEEFGVKISDDANLFHMNHWVEFTSTKDPDDEERCIMVTKKVLYSGAAYYFPQAFATVATQVGSCAEHYNTVYSMEYFDRSSSLHAPSVDDWGTGREGCIARALPPTFMWGVVGYVSPTQRVVRTITTDFGWKKNGAEVEQMQLQDLGPTANGTFYLQTLKREFDGKPVCSGYISYTYTPWGAMPSFFMDGGEKLVGCQILKQCEFPNKKVDPADWYNNMVSKAANESSSSPFRSAGSKFTKVKRSDVQMAMNDKIKNKDAFKAAVDEEDEEEHAKFEEMHEAALAKRAAIEESKIGDDAPACCAEPAAAEEAAAPVEEGKAAAA